MGSLIGTLLGLNATDAAADPDKKVTLNDIEAHLRSIGSDAHTAIESSTTNLLGAAALGLIALVGASYLHGRRRGRKRSSVLEIRRV